MSRRSENPSQRMPSPQAVRARGLRREAPFPERLLWNRLRARQLAGLYFRRQHPIGPYFADFFCAAAKLVIELDGFSHDDRAAHDARRTGFIQSQGLRVIRFCDDEVLHDLDDVIYRIACEAGTEAAPSPSPSRGRGVGAPAADPLPDRGGMKNPPPTPPWEGGE